MTNQNLIQRGTHTTGLGVVIAGTLLIINVGDSVDILRMLAILISDTQMLKDNASKTSNEKMEKIRQQKVIDYYLESNTA